MGNRTVKGSITTKLSNSATHLEHFVDVVIFVFQQFTPGSEITVCEHTAGLQQSVSMTLRTRFSQHYGV